MKKFSVVNIGFLLAVILVLSFAQVALGDPHLEVTLNGSEVINDDSKLVSVKTVKISVYDSNGEATGILINDKSVKSVKDKVYTWEASCSLQTGKNTFEIESQGPGDSVSLTFDVTYTTLPLPGLVDSVSSLPASGKIVALNKALTLTYPKDNILVNEDGEIWDGDQAITFETVSPPDDLKDRRPDDYHYLASPGAPFVVKITADPGAYLLFPGEITLSYDKNISSTVADQLAIWYSPDEEWNEDPQSLDNLILGGRVDASKGTVTAPFQFRGNDEDGEGYYAVFLSQRQFQEFHETDGPTVSWAYSTVLPMWAKGIAETNDQGPTEDSRNTSKTTDENWFGLINDNGNPKNITRLEFAAMMIKGLALPLVKKPSDEEETFSDVKYNDRPEHDGYFGSNYVSSINYYDYDNDYEYDHSIIDEVHDHSIIQYVETAAQKGIFSGYPDGTFKPANELSRVEAAVILARISNLKLSDDDQKVSQDLEKIFEDAEDIPLWAASSVLAAQKAKLIVGVPSSDPDSKLMRFNPDDPLSRAEAITLAYRLLKKLKKI